MNYLVDTHVFLWTLFSPQKISKRVQRVLIDPEATKYVSAVTFWEISLKYALGKMDLIGASPDKLLVTAKDTGFQLLPLECDIASSSYTLPKLRAKDPFDRMLAWQAVNLNYYLLTKDEDFTVYEDFGLKLVW